MGVWLELTEPVDEFPDVCPPGVKDVRPVHVDEHTVATIATLGVAVPSDVGACIEHVDLMSGLSEPAGDDGPGEACTGDADSHHYDSSLVVVASMVRRSSWN